MDQHLETAKHTIDTGFLIVVMWLYDANHIIAALTIVWLIIKICKELHLFKLMARYFRRNNDGAE